jgi:hypothetical protein
MIENLLYKREKMNELFFFNRYVIIFLTNHICLLSVANAQKFNSIQDSCNRPTGGWDGGSLCLDLVQENMAVTVILLFELMSEDFSLEYSFN